MSFSAQPNSFPENLGEWMSVKRLAMIAVIVVMEAPSPPPIRITPPRVLIVIGIWIVIIVLRPKINLFARNDRVPILHFAERFNLFSYNFTSHGDLFLPSVNVRV
jgi:hypothetical protein